MSLFKRRVRDPLQCMKWGCNRPKNGKQGLFADLCGECAQSEYGLLGDIYGSDWYTVNIMIPEERGSHEAM